ncbi:MAG: SIR2 family protein [Candidatus Omnitrophica bacterium]|nr:SIR2 family protein [Candidatus Omnitrophota bacterium]
MNRYILNSKIILFLGAGASEFLGKPLMSNFVDKLIDDINDDKLRGILLTIVESKGKDLEILLKEIDGICERNYFKGQFKRNYIKDQLDIIGSLARALLTSTSQTEIGYKSDFAAKYEALCQECYRLKWRIYDKIFEVYFDIDRMQVKRLYSPLFRILKEILREKRVLPIFTTNYDKAIEAYTEDMDDVELIDGFKTTKSKTSIWKITVFEKFKPIRKRMNICLFKLHGSIFWYRLEGNIVYSPIATQFPSHVNIEPVILYPNDIKQIAFSDPFITAYSYFQGCLSRASYIIFIGYSFRDYITITFLKNALRMNKKLKVVIFDPNATKIFKAYFSFYKNNVVCIDKKFTDKAEDYQDEILKTIHLE